MRARSTNVGLRIGFVVLMLLLGACSRQPAPSAQPAPAAASQPAQSAAPAAPKAAPAAPVELGNPVPPFKFLYPTQSYWPQIYESCGLLAGELKKLGISHEVLTHPTWGAFTSQVGQPFDWGIACQGYVAREDRLDPHTFLDTFRSEIKGPPNYSGYSSKDYDAAVAAEQSELDQVRRKAAVFKAQEVMARDLPFAGLWYPQLTTVYNKARFGNVQSTPGVGLFNFNNIVNATPLTSDTVFRAGYVGDMGLVNPANVLSSFDLELVRLIWEPLGVIKPDGTVQPWLAEKWEVTSPTSLKLTIRDGHRFHDGKPVTAKDVAFSYNFMLKWKPAWYRTWIDPIKSVEAPDSRTVNITLSKPYGPIFITLATIPILPEHLWGNIVAEQGVKTPAELKNLPRIGSGPFKWASQTAQAVRMLRNDSHFSPPKASEFLWMQFANRESHFLAMVNETIFFHEQKGMTVTQADDAKKYPHLGVLTEPSIAAYVAYFNMRDNSVFKDYTLRLATSHLLDTNAYVRDILQGFGDPGRGLIAPANKAWFNNALPTKETPGKVHYNEFDPAKAKSILQKAGFGWDASGRLHYPKDYKPTTLPNPQGCCE